MSITNHTSTTWDSGYVVSYHVYSADGTQQVVAQGHQTALPSSVAPGATVNMTAILDPLAAGTYTIYWDMQQLPSTWFSGAPFNIPMLWARTPFTSVSQPVINSTSPATGATVPSLTPTLSVSATDPQGKAMTYHFRLCTGADAASGACDDSGTISPPSWTIPKNTLNWGTTYYWVVYVSDGTGTAASAISSITPTLPVVQPAWSFGWDPFASYSAGVNTALGNYVTSATDLKVSTIGPALQLTRTFNSMDTHTGWFGKGWSSTYETWIETSTDGYANAIIHYADGRLEFHSNNQDGTFADAIGFTGHLAGSAAAGYALTSPDHSQLTFAGATGRLTSSKDANGRLLSLTYSGAAPSQLVTITDATSGRALHLSWAGGQPSSVSSDAPLTGVAPLTVYYTYSTGQLAGICDPRSSSATDTTYCTNFFYSNGQLTKITRPLGNVGLALSYDSSGRVATLQDGMSPAGQWSYAYAASSVSGETKQTTVADPRGNMTISGYNSLNQLMRHLDEEGNARTYGFDGRGLVNLVKDENGNSTIFNHDSRGNISSQVDAAGHTTYFEYYLNPTDPNDLRNDRLIHQRDPRSASATDNTYLSIFDYDTLGNRIRQTDPPTSDVSGGAVSTWTYSDGTSTYPAYGGGNTPAGLLVQVQDPRGSLTKYAYDTRGDLRQLTDRVGLMTTFSYDNLGRRISRLVMATGFSSGLTTQYGFDALGHVTSQTDPALTNTVTGVTHARLTTTSYDRNGNIATIVVSDSAGGDASRTTSYTYDADDRVSTVKNPQNGISSVYYDPVGNPTRSIDVAGHETDTAYTARNLQLTVTLKGFVDNPVTGTTPRDVVIARYAYDAGGRRTTVTDPLGRQRTFAWFADNRLKQASLLNYHNPDGTSRTVVLGALAYDAAGNLTSATVGTPGTGTSASALTYDAAGHLKTVTQDPRGLNRVTTLTYDAGGDIIARSLTDGAVTESTSYSYDAEGRPTQQSVNNGAAALVSASTYDNRGLRIASVDPRGNVTGGTPQTYETDYTYDAAGQVATSVSPAVSVESNGAAPTQARPTNRYGYDTFGDKTQMKDANGNVTSYVFDALGRRTSVSHPAYITPATQTSAGGTVINPTENALYDAIGSMLRYTDTRGQSTDYVYDARNRLVQQTDPLVTGASARGATTYTYDDANNPFAVVNPLGARAEATYDDQNRMRTFTEVVRGTTTARYTATYDYNDLGNQVLATSPLGENRLSIFDNAGELTQTTDGNGVLENYSYDLAGRLRRVTDGLNRAAEYVYDLAGRQTAVKNYDHAGALLTQAQVAYDPAGNAISSTSPNGITGGYSTTRSYDALSQLTAMTEPVSATTSIVTSFGYDSAGHQTRVTDGNGHVRVTTYNALGLPESSIEPATTAFPATADRTFTTTYDAGGLPVTYNLPGSTVSRTFDQLGRLTQESGLGTGLTSATRALGWDLAGNLTSLSHPSGTIAFARDDRGLLTTASGPTDSSSFAYDADGRLSSRTDASGTATFTYYGNGQLKSSSDPLAGVTQTRNYDAAAQLVSITTGVAGATRTYTYDDLGRMMSDTLGDPANPSTATHTISYSYDGNSNRTATVVGPAGLANSAANNSSYTYDRADRLASWTDNATSTTTTYGWDGAGNRLSAGATTASFDERNRILSDSTGMTYSWNARGTLSSTYTGGKKGTTTTYNFDALAQMTSDSSGNTYGYDGLGRLAQRTGLAWVCTWFCTWTNVTTPYKYAGDGPKPISDGTYLYSRLPSGSVSAMSNGTTARLAGVDQHGDLTYTYNSTGTIVDAASYDPFGKPRTAFASGGPTIGYQGEWTNGGNVDMSARWYRPSIGSFLSRDRLSVPVQTASDVNQYLYAGANPINRTDPGGTDWVAITNFVWVCTLRFFDWCLAGYWDTQFGGWQWVDPNPQSPPGTQPPSSPPLPSSGQPGGGTPSPAPGPAPSPSNQGAGPPNPGPQISNRSAYDPNWQAHVQPYNSGQAPIASGLPTPTPQPGPAPSASVAETVTNPSTAGGESHCTNCTQLLVPPTSQGGSLGAQPNSPAVPPVDPLNTTREKLSRAQQIRLNNEQGANFEAQGDNLVETLNDDPSYYIKYGKAVRDVNGKVVRTTDGRLKLPDNQVIDRQSGQIVSIWDSKSGTEETLNGRGARYQRDLEDIASRTGQAKPPEVNVITELKPRPAVRPLEGLGGLIGVLAVFDMIVNIEKNGGQLPTLPCPLGYSPELCKYVGPDGQITF
jgi:RHS repeat-associated protein